MIIHQLFPIIVTDTTLYMRCMALCERGCVKINSALLSIYMVTVSKLSQALYFSERNLQATIGWRNTVLWK
jgi:hypothetical protein